MSPQAHELREDASSGRRPRRGDAVPEIDQTVSQDTDSVLAEKPGDVHTNVDADNAESSCQSNSESDSIYGEYSEFAKCKASHQDLKVAY